MLFYLLVLGASTDTLTLVVDEAQACVFLQTDELGLSKEAADIVVDAALTACLSERAAVRTAMHNSIAKNNPTLPEKNAASAEKWSFDLNEKTLRDRALLRLVRTRATNAQQ